MPPKTRRRLEQWLRSAGEGIPRLDRRAVLQMEAGEWSVILEEDEREIAYSDRPTLADAVNSALDQAGAPRTEGADHAGA